MRIIRASIAACLGIFAVSGTAQAEFMFQFDQSSYEVTAGEVFDVQLYLVETGTSILATDGLISAATKLTYNESPFASDPAQIGSLADVAMNPGFNFTSGETLTQATGSSAGTVNLPMATLGDAVKPEAASPDRILLATFTFTAGGIVGEITSLSASILANSTQSNFVTGGIPPLVLDSMISGGQARILVIPSGVVIPEPSSVVLAGLGLSVALGSVVRRRRPARS